MALDRGYEGRAALGQRPSWRADPEALGLAPDRARGVLPVLINDVGETRPANRAGLKKNVSIDK